jgi:hypothetical protein
MDNTGLVREVAELFRTCGHSVVTSIKINHREIDVRAEETQGLVRKIILIECADYEASVGVDKLQTDITKLRAARESLGDSAVIMHVSRNGYSPDASGYAADQHITTHTLNDLQVRLVNFAPYIEAIEHDKLREPILKEYQPNKIHFEGLPSDAQLSLDFLSTWLSSGRPWLTLLGDYGVGKSWTLRRFLYDLLDQYKQAPSTKPLPFFVPLQHFTKSFDFENLILRTLQLYGVSGVHYSAFQYLMSHGRIVFLLDSFDEMAQHLSRDVIRENLKELLVGTTGHSRVIMTSRPNYFEGRAERLLVVEKEGLAEWHPLDRAVHDAKTSSSRIIEDKLQNSQYARICDLTVVQRKRLFEIVLGKGTPAQQKLLTLFTRFQNLDTLSQRAVIARLLTTVAATLAKADAGTTVEGVPLLPEDLQTLNEAKIFQIVLHNLLQRDQGIGALGNIQRLSFLRAFAVFLQQKTADAFATPSQLRSLVAQLFDAELRRSDAPQQLLESYYRTCRRHSGLTTESQFRDTSGQVDVPVDAEDADSRVGFSHNSLREYLVADSIVQLVKTGVMVPGLRTVVVSDVVGDFAFGMAEYDKDLPEKVATAYATATDERVRELLFKTLYAFFRKVGSSIALLGSPPIISAVDLSNLDLSGLNLNKASIQDCIAQDVDFRKSDLRGAAIVHSTFDNASFDGALLERCDLTQSEIISIYGFDQYDTRTAAVLRGRAARQWLYTRGALVHPSDDLNPLLGKPWYEAAREVAKTLERRIAGTHQDISLAKGTKHEQRTFATEFVQFLVKKGILEVVVKSAHGPGYVVKLAQPHRDLIVNFSQRGEIAPILQPFFDKKLKPDQQNRA